MSDVLLFLREFARKPGQLGAVMPSSAGLAQSVVRAAGLTNEQVVVELGAGTGPFTRAIVAAVPDCKFVAFEPSDVLAARLRDDLPGIDLVERYASDLPEVLAERNYERCDRVISGLPWAVFDEPLQREILSAVTQCLAADGRFITFQYVHSQVLPAARRFYGVMNEHFTSIHKTDVTWLNVPPAFLYVCEGPRKQQ